jgi:hypothetical protein
LRLTGYKVFDPIAVEAELRVATAPGWWQSSLMSDQVSGKPEATAKTSYLAIGQYSPEWGI